jgi:dienelactone hydrolase
MLQMYVSRPAYVSVVFLLITIVSSVDAIAQTFDHSESGRLTRLWIPADAGTVRGILIVGNGAGGDSTGAALNPIYQRFGQLHRFAVIGTGFWSNFSSSGEISMWDNHLAALATASGHPELIHAPYAPIGFSNGGQMSYGFNALRPEKVIAFIANKGCCYNARLPSESALQTPGLLIAGELDTQVRRDSIRGLFNDNRPRGALWSWVEEENTGHARTDDEIVLPFMAEAIRLRYPNGELPTATSGVILHALSEEDGWLAEQSTWMSGLVTTSSYAEYVGDKSTAGWLLNGNMAQLYRAFATYDKPVSIQVPSSPVLLGESLSSNLPVTLNVQVNTAAMVDWTKVELFDYAQKIGDVLAGGGPSTIAVVPTTLSAGRIHALTALVTGSDGATVRTTNVVTILTAALRGDYNYDGNVDAADYVVWRKSDGSSAGYETWRANFGKTAGNGSAASANATVPELATMVMLIVAAAGVSMRRCRGTRRVSKLINE